ncbi:MAG: hypothetical protein ACO1QB_18235 [Verrucomicrobiales bacterium]
MKVPLLITTIVAIAASSMAVHYRTLSLQSQHELAALKASIEAEATRTAAEQPQKALELERQKQERLELLTLRGEVTQLKGEAKQAQALRQQNQSLTAANQQLRNAAAQAQNQQQPLQNEPDTFTKESWTFAGYDTPESTLISAIWAMKEGDPKLYFESLAPEEQERIAKTWEDKDLDAVAAKQKGDVEKITSIKVLEKQQLSEHEVQMSVYIEGVDRMEKVVMKRSDDGWKFGGFIPPQSQPQ